MKEHKLKVLMYEHGGNRNRGCEAILRSTCALLRYAIPEIEVTVISHEPNYDFTILIPGVKEYISRTGYRVGTHAWFIAGVSRRLRIDSIVKIPNYLEQTIYQSDLCMSIGGDNYCYKEYFPSFLISVDKMAKKYCKSLVLWGASIERNLITKEIRTDLESFDLISVRETISYETLDDLGIKGNLHMFPDPAFSMQKEEMECPNKWNEGNTIGINISPLILKYEAKHGALIKGIVELVKHILKNTECTVALIPHVFLKSFNDIETLREVFTFFQDTGRVILIDEEYSAPALKGLISQCRLFIGARTHAIIAAYSSCVPTLALGYSVKARGIARDIFGNEKGLVLPIQNLSSPNRLIYLFDELLEREVDLRLKLMEVMPIYVKQAHLSIEQVRALL